MISESLILVKASYLIVFPSYFIDLIIFSHFPGKIQNSSVMISESDFSSDEETIFMNPKKSNGHLPKTKNGLSKPHYKNKLKT